MQNCSQGVRIDPASAPPACFSGSVLRVWPVAVMPAAQGHREPVVRFDPKPRGRARTPETQMGRLSAAEAADRPHGARLSPQEREETWLSLAGLTLARRNRNHGLRPFGFPIFTLTAPGFAIDAAGLAFLARESHGFCPQRTLNHVPWA